MRKRNQPRGKWRNVVFGAVAVIIVVADQLTKLWIRSTLVVGQSLPGTEFPRIIHIENSGAAFGLFQGQSLPLTIASVVAIVILLYYVFSLYRRFPYLDSGLGKFTLGLILGGVIGNLIDRLRFGYVTDFIDFGFWPAFNIADSAVTVGVILLAIILLLLARSVEAER